jgi:hypothetical protein
MASIQNNLQHNREKVQQRGRASYSSSSDSNAVANTKQPLAAGFDYAVQADGTILAERRWRELRRTAHTCFTFARLIRCPTDVSTSSSNSVDSLNINKFRLGKYYIEHGRVNPIISASLRLPPPPPPPLPPPQNRPEPRQTMHSHAHAPPPPVPPRVATPPQQAQQLPPQQAQDRTEILSNMPEHDNTGPIFLSPTRRIRNRHNAVYGEHRPTAQNSPGCALKVFGAQAVQRQERNLCQELLSNGSLAQEQQYQEQSDHRTSNNKNNNGGPAATRHTIRVDDKSWEAKFDLSCACIPNSDVSGS